MNTETPKFLTGEIFYIDSKEDIEIFMKEIEGEEMALETLKDVKEIGGFKVFEGSPCKYDSPSDIYVMADHSQNSLHFKIQHGPIKEHGVNGCQVDTIIEAAKVILEGLNKMFPCRENACAITKLDEALHWLDHRKKDREKRGVEGKNET